jgi:hypothetical protein
MVAAEIIISVVAGMPCLWFWRRAVGGSRRMPGPGRETSGIAQIFQDKDLERTFQRAPEDWLDPLTSNN